MILFKLLLRYFMKSILLLVIAKSCPPVAMLKGDHIIVFVG